MNSTQLIDALTTSGTRHVFNHFLMNEDVFILKQKFPNNHVEVYHSLKADVADHLKVPIKNIAIVGSAKTGYSLTPGKNFSAFNQDSDLDLVVVSSDLYKQLWDSHLKFKNSIMKGRSYSYAAVAKEIFRHFVSIAEEDISVEMQEYFSVWIDKVGVLKKVIEQRYKTPSEINYRVYDSWQYVEEYHIDGLEKILEGIQK